MADFSSGAALWAERAVGASAGAAVSLIYLLPKNRREAASRFFAGLTCGLIFGGPAGLWLAGHLALEGQLSPFDITLSGSAAASLCAWWGLGVLQRLAGRLGR